MKIDRKLRHASHTTIFSALRQVISGFTSGHASAPGTCRKITRLATPICGAAIPRPYPVLARQCASVSAKSATSTRISGAAGSTTGAATSRNPGSPNCKIVFTATISFFSVSSALLASVHSVLSLFRPLPLAGLCRLEYGLDHRHIRNRIFQRHGNLSLASYGPRKLVALNCVLVDDRKLLHFRHRPRRIPNEDSARPVIRRVPRNFNFHPSRRAEKMHRLKVCALRKARKRRLPGRKFQDRGRQAVCPEIRIALQRPSYPHRLLSKNEARHRNRVASDIQQTASTPLDFVPHIVRIPVEVAEDAHRRVQVSNRPATDNFLRAQPLRVRLHHERFPDFYAGPISRRKQSLRLRHRRTNRLFAEHMLPCFRCFDRPRHMQMIRQRIVDSFDLAIIQKLFVRAVRLGNAKLARRFLGLLPVARGNRRDFAERTFLHAGNYFAQADGRGSQDSPLDLFHSLLRGDATRRPPCLIPGASTARPFCLIRVNSMVPSSTRANLRFSKSKA